MFCNSFCISVEVSVLSTTTFLRYDIFCWEIQSKKKIKKKKCCAICRFSQVVCHFEQPHAQSLFLFPMVFGINLIHFFRWEEQSRMGRHIFDHLFFDHSCHLRESEQRVRIFVATDSVNSLCESQRPNGDHLRREKRKV